MSGTESCSSGLESSVWVHSCSSGLWRLQQLLLPSSDIYSSSTACLAGSDQFPSTPATDLGLYPGISVILPGVSTATESAPSPVASPGPHSTRPPRPFQFCSLYVAKTSTAQGLLDIAKLSCQLGVQLWPRGPQHLSTVSEETVLRRSHVSDVRLLLITTEFSAPANQFKLSQESQVTLQWVWSVVHHT